MDYKNFDEFIEETKNEFKDIDQKTIVFFKKMVNDSLNKNSDPIANVLLSASLLVKYLESMAEQIGKIEHFNITYEAFFKNDK